MWNFLEDHTPAVITAQCHIESAHANEKLSLPQTAVLFYMHGGEAFVRKNYKTRLISKRFPRFLASCPVYRLRHHPLCFLDGGRGAPQAVDTLETLAALGVQNVICLGMCGVFAGGLTCGDILIPSKAFVEEGTSLHYFPSITFSQPDQVLHQTALQTIFGAKDLPIVSTDAVYRQTFFKENLWRGQGAAGVDMETSALFSVGAFLKMHVVSVLVASDVHPLAQGEESWQWKLSGNMRKAFFDKCVGFALNVADGCGNLL